VEGVPETEKAASEERVAEIITGNISDLAIRNESKVFDELRLVVSGSISWETADRFRSKVEASMDEQPLKNVVLDLEKVTHCDSAGCAVVTALGRKCRNMGNSFRIVNTGPELQELLTLAEARASGRDDILRSRQTPNMLVQIGSGVESFGNNIRDILTFIGASAIAIAKDIRNPGSVRRDSLWHLMERAGADAVFITTALSFLMGAVLAFQAAVQLRKFGATIFVADLVSVSICMEMGPLLTALIVAGRSGAGYAAHIGTMQVNEEVDALRVMGIDPIRYLVSPRIIAVGLVLPLLTVFADIMGIFGGCVVGWAALDLTPITYFNQVGKVLEVSDVMKGLIKSFAYGIEIALIGCMRGFQVRGGAESVGTATTSAVVTCIFLLTLTDAVFAVVFHYIGY
jgi:phospholipid/cholesterol/gamma-HCH transport system permease protein